MSRFNAFETRTPKYENSGSQLEAEFIGNINKKKYDELAYNYLKEERGKLFEEFEGADPDNEPKNDFERLLKAKEAADQRFNSFQKFRRKENYIDYKNSMDLIEKSQYGDPEKPAKFFSASLYKYIKERFEDKYSLKFYTATGLTHLDILHGVDCFFKLCNKETGEELTNSSIDLTGNRDKEYARANVLIQISNEERGKMDSSKINEDFDREDFEAKIASYGEIIIVSLIENYQQNNN